MHRSLFIFLSCVLVQGAFALIETDITCMDTYNNTLDNDYLIGEWRVVYQFSGFLNTIPSISCKKYELSEFTDEEIAEYKEHYTDTSVPYNMDDRPIKYNEDDGWNEGMLMGRNEVKFLIFKPGSAMVLSNGYRAEAYRKVDDNFMLYIDCNLRSATIWLYSRGAEIPTVATLDAVIAGIPEVQRFDKRRYCASF